MSERNPPFAPGVEEFDQRHRDLETEIATRTAAEIALREALIRRQQQFEAVGIVGQAEALVAGDVEALAREITERAARTIGCERINVWLFNEDETELRCIDLYEATTGRHSSGMVLREAEFAREFQAIKDAKYVDADDALNDPRTAGYVEGYVKPLGITSMLDILIGFSGRSFGLLCFEHVGNPHRWEADEIAFGSQLADKLGIAIVNRTRRQDEAKIRASEAALAAAQAIAHLGSWELDVAAQRLSWSRETYRIFGVDPAAFQPSYEALLGRVHPDDRAMLDRVYKEAVESHRPHDFEHRIVLEGGAIRWVHELGETHYDQAGNPVRSAGTVQDITERKIADEVLQRERDFTRTMIDTVPGIFFVLDGKGNNVRFNANLMEVTGRSREELQGMNAFTYVAPEDRERVRVRMGEIINGGPSGREVGLVNLDGEVRQFFIAARPIQLESGPGIVGIGVDVTEGKMAERRLRESEGRFKGLVENTLDWVWEFDGEFRFTYSSPRCHDMLGYTPAEMLGRSAFDFMTPHDARHTMEASADLFEQRKPMINFETTFVHKSGRSVDTETNATPFFDFDGRYCGYRGIDRDITERKRAAAQIMQLARFDVLTGLANRRVFAEAVQQAIARAQRGSRGFAVLYLDLDHFKDVNDTLGHPVGDVLLKSVAKRLKACVRETDTVARFGGDEFAVLAVDIAEPADAGVLGEKILAALSGPVVVNGNEIRSGTSVGIAVYGPDSPEAETLLAHADVALYRAKTEGRGTFRFFTDSMDADVRKRVKMDADLRTALEADQMFLVWQPQVEADSGRIIGLEALVRWRHPERGIVSPAEFIPAAEKNGLIVPLGRWVLRAACRQAKAWRDSGLDPGSICVNVSALQFKTPRELERSIAEALADNDLPPRLLELELTESVLMKASSDHNDVLLRLRKRGIRLAIDDFGTGYSSLDYLRRFPVDRIKIAQCFIIDLVTAAGDAAIVKAAIGLARELGIDIIAEGVESEAQLHLLQAWGCRAVQGYYFAKPLIAEAVEPLLRSGYIRVGPAALVA